MKTGTLTIIATLAVALAAGCGGHSEKRGGGLNLGKEAAIITLPTGTTPNLVFPNNQGPTGIVRIAANASGSTLSGLNAAMFTDGDAFWIRNDGASGSLTLTNADSTSTAANQFTIVGGTSLVLTPHMAVLVEFDATAGFVVSPSALANSPVSQETITSGSMNLAFATSYTSTTGTVAYTMPNGTFSGQIHCFEEVTAASSPVGTVTITTPAGSEPSTHVMTAIGQRLCAVWNGVGWHTFDKHRAGQQAVVVGTTVLTGFDMCEEYALSVTGTVTSTGTKAIPNGLVPMERMHVMTPTAASTPNGTINVTGTTIATGVAATALSGINATTVSADFVWDGLAWQNVQLTTATYSMLEDLFINLANQVASNDNHKSDEWATEVKRAG